MRNSHSQNPFSTIRLLTSGLKKLIILFFLGAFVAPFAWTGPAHALTFQEAAQKGDATIAELEQLKVFVGKAGLRQLKKLKLSNIKVQGNTLTGDVKFMKIDWTFIASAGGTIKNTFIGFGPKRIFKFKDMFPRAKGVELLDVMKFNDQILLVAAADIEIENDDLSANAKATLGRFYEKPKFTFEMKQGVSMFASFDMADAKPIADAMKFLGGKSTKIQLKGDLSPNVLDSLLEGSLPQPSLNLTAAMPTFRPKIGGLIQLPADVQFTYNAELTKESVAVGFAGKTKFKIGKQLVDVTLSNTLKAAAGKPPSMSVKIATFKGEPWKQAFGVKWLTIEDYSMAFKVNATGKLSIGMDGTTSFGEKAVGLGGSIQIQAASLGIPLPESLRFEINDGPNKIGALALQDMASVYNIMAKASGNPVLIPLDKVPDVAIAGTKKGEGPKIELTLAASGDAGIDMSGKLRILGTDIATIDKAFIQADQGIEIRAKAGNIKIGPITLPSADVEVVLRIDRDEGTFPTPRVLLKTKGLSLFGSKNEMDISMFLTSSSMVVNQDFGELFKFDFRAFAGLKGLDKFEDLAKADYRIMASLQSDPGKFIRDGGAKAVKKAFGGLTREFDKAVKDLEKAQAEVSKLSGEITKMRNIVKKEKEPSIDRLKNAEAEVAKLTSTIAYLDGRIGVYKKSIKSCKQSTNVCYKWKLTGGGCKAKKLGICYKWHSIKSRCSASKSVPNYPARGVCEAKNTKPRTELAWAQTKKTSVVVAKVTAGETVKAIRQGIENLPVDLDPRVAGLIIAKTVAVGVLEAAKQVVKGAGSFANLLAKGIEAAGKPDIFALEKSSIQGSLKEGFNGRPVVLDMNFRLLGKSYNNRFGFSLTDWKFNAKQFEVIAFAAASQTIIKLGKDLKVIPHVLLNKVNALYLKRQAEVDAILQKAMVANGQIKSKEGAAKLSMGRSIDMDNRIRRIKQESARNRKIAMRGKIRKILDNKRRLQLANLPRGAKNLWKKMPGAALDIGAGANGSVWVVGTNGSPYSWTGKNWKKMPGGITRLDIGPKGDVWAVNKNQSIYQWTGKKWNGMPGKAWDIGVGANGKVWVIGTKKEAGGFAIYRLDGKKWTKIPGSAVRIDVDPKGNAWVVNKANKIFRYNGKKWVGTSGRALDIAISSNGTVMVVGTNRAPYVWKDKKWRKLPGANLTNMTLDRSGNPLGTNTKKEIWGWGAAAKSPPAKMVNLSNKKIQDMIRKQKAKRIEQIKAIQKKQKAAQMKRVKDMKRKLGIK
jgi:hypothetical protein